MEEIQEVQEEKKRSTVSFSSASSPSVYHTCFYACLSLRKESDSGKRSE